VGRSWILRLLVAAAVLGLTVTVANADEGAANLSARLTGFEETPPILTNGTGTFVATVQGSSLTYRLTYSGLSAPVTQAHIHFAQRGVAGAVVVWLCGTATNPGPAGTPTCPAGGGTVTRTVTAADVQAVPAQGVAAGDFAGLLRFIRNDDGYVNFHTTAHPAGEIRGQIRAGESD
jgi:CHRD domain-containing protein